VICSFRDNLILIACSRIKGREGVLMNKVLVILLLSMIGSTCVSAAESAASVILSVGKNTAQLPDQELRSLKRKSLIFQQDLVSTGSNGRLQLRFTDNSRVSLRPDTLFKVDEYQYQKNDPSKGKSVYRLLKGGLRTITGAISGADVDNYQIQTPIATIGVRGTHYSLFYCDTACHEATRSRVGLYGYVLEGEIVVGNDQGMASVVAGHYFFLGGSGSSLQIQETPFDLFEQLKDLGPDLMAGPQGNSVPALDVNSRSVIRTIPEPAQFPETIPSPRGYD
jgi:hypothetical protein